MLISCLFVFAFICETHVIHMWFYGYNFTCEPHVIHSSFPHVFFLPKGLASFYVYNVEYSQSKAILTFFKQALLEIGRRQKFVTVNSFFNKLALL